MLQLINDVLDLSKIEAGVLDLYYSEFGLNGVLATLKGVVESRLQDRVDLIFEPGMPDDYVVYSEKNRLQQLVLNFLTNACKFTSTGSIRYGYEVRDKDIYYYVTDTGTHGSTLSIIPEERAKAMASSLPEIPKSPSNHFENFLLACNGVEKTRSPFEIHGTLSQVFSLGVIAQRMNTQLFFDPRTKQITNNEFANAMLAGMPPRKEWEEFYKL